jgi:hypothetical protein
MQNGSTAKIGVDEGLCGVRKMHVPARVHHVLMRVWLVGE